MISAKIMNYKKEYVHCSKCKGRCWNQNNSVTQENARKMFGGITPNNCVVSENGTPQCPFSK